MVAVTGTRSSEGNDEEARLRKQIKDRKDTLNAASRRARGRLKTSLHTFAERVEADSEETPNSTSVGKKLTALSLDTLVSLHPREAVRHLQHLGGAIRENFNDMTSKARSTRAWVRKAWREGKLYHQILVRTVISLEFKRLIDERRFAALDNVFASVPDNVDDAEIERAMETFDATVKHFTIEREKIMRFEQKKAANKAAKRSAYIQGINQVNTPSPAFNFSFSKRERESVLSQAEEVEPTSQVTRQLDAVYDEADEEERARRREEGEEDEEDETDIAADADVSEEDEEYEELEYELKHSPFLRTSSGKNVFQPASFAKRKQGSKLAQEAEKIGRHANVTDVTRDLSTLAKAMLSEADEVVETSSKKVDNPNKSLSFRSDISDSELPEDDEEDFSAFGRAVNDLSNEDLRATIVRLVRTSTWHMFEDANSSRLAYFVAIFFITLICVSSLVFCLETLPRYDNDPKAQDAFYAVEVFAAVMFTIEYVVRSLCCPNWRRFVIQPLNIVDLVAVLPFYLELMMPMSVAGIQVLRTIRLVRVLRILRLGVKFGRLAIIGQSINECLDMLLVSIAIASVSIVIFSTLIYYAEHGEYIESLDIYARSTDVACDGLADDATTIYNSDGSLVSQCQYVESPYKSIPASFWWAIVTLMTVGYGDHVPSTGWGKFVACLTMVVSVLLLALPISVIGTEFTRRWLDWKTESEYDKEKKLLSPRFHKLLRALRLQLRAAQDAQVDMRSRAMGLDDRIQTIKALVQRRNSETAFLKRKIAARTNFKTSLDKTEAQLDMDDLDVEMHSMFAAHRDYRSVSREVDTIWGGNKLKRFTEFLISAEHVLDGLCGDDYDLVIQELDSLFFEVWRVRAKLCHTFKPSVKGKKKVQRAVNAIRLGVRTGVISGQEPAKASEAAS